MNFDYCEGRTHVIEKGDTLYRLSKKYQVPLAMIMRANPYVDVYNLTIGEELCIPVPLDLEPPCRPCSNGACPSCPPRPPRPIRPGRPGWYGSPNSAAEGGSTENEGGAESMGNGERMSSGYSAGSSSAGADSGESLRNGGSLSSWGGMRDPDRTGFMNQPSGNGRGDSGNVRNTEDTGFMERTVQNGMENAGSVRNTEDSGYRNPAGGSGTGNPSGGRDTAFQENTRWLNGTVWPQVSENGNGKWMDPPAVPLPETVMPLPGGASSTGAGGGGSRRNSRRITMPSREEDFSEHLITYIMKDGDTLESILLQFDLALEDLLKFNSLKDICLKEGCILKIPEKEEEM